MINGEVIQTLITLVLVIWILVSGFMWKRKYVQPYIDKVLEGEK